MKLVLRAVAHVLFWIGCGGTVCAAHAATPRLDADCAVARDFRPAAATPFDLDWCALAAGDDVRALLLDIADRWPGGVFLLAPSRTLTVVSDSIDWTRDPVMPVRTFELRERASGTAHLTVRHAPTTNPWRLWTFENYRSVQIGGPRLAISFEGTHPGLGNGEGEHADGLLTFLSTNGGTPDLVDIRANISDARAKGLYIGSAVRGTTLGAVTDRVRQVNVAGEFWNAGLFVHSGVQRLWLDPAALVVADPYNRYYGWDGGVAMTAGGRRIGCMDAARAQIRNGAGVGFYYVDHVAGGVTFEYGLTQLVLRANGAIGNSVADPFVVRLKDWGASGPQSRTGYPAGVMVRKTVEANFHKGDDNYELGHSAPFRFLRVEMLAPEFGNGFWSEPITAACAAGNRTANADSNGQSNFWRFEANRGGQPTQNRNAYFDVEFRGEFDHSFGDKAFRGPLVLTAFEPETTPGPAVADRSYGHVIRAGPGTHITDTVNLHDTITATGAGSWRHLTVKDIATADSRGVLHPHDNVVRDTHVSGTIEIGAHAQRTLIDNVRFDGPARTLITVGPGSDARIAHLCAAAGSRLAGLGSVEYDGARIELPYVIRRADDCTL